MATYKGWKDPQDVARARGEDARNQQSARLVVRQAEQRDRDVRLRGAYKDEKTIYLDQLPHLDPGVRAKAEQFARENPACSSQRFKTLVAAIQRPPQSAEVVAERSRQFIDMRALGEAPGDRRAEALALDARQQANGIEGELLRTTGLGADPHYAHLSLSEARERIANARRYAEVPDDELPPEAA